MANRWERKRGKEMANRRLRVLICQQQKLANCTPDCDTGRERINPPTPLSLPLSPFLSFNSPSLPLQTTERGKEEGEREREQARRRERQPVNFYSSPKSLLAISVRQGRQQLLVITGSPSLLLSVGKRREGGRKHVPEPVFIFIYIFLYPWCWAT